MNGFTRLSALQVFPFVRLDSFITLILIGKHDKTRDTTYVCVVINSAALWNWSTLICFCDCPAIPIPCNMQWYIVSHENDLQNDNHNNLSAQCNVSYLVH